MYNLDGISTKNKLKELEASLELREKYLMPIYHQIAVQFADLHDTPGRMLQKKVIKEIIDWPTSRKYFYWRFRRLIARNNLIRAIMDHTKNQVGFEQAYELARKCFYHDNDAKLSSAQIEVRYLI